MTRLSVSLAGSPPLHHLDVVSRIRQIHIVHHRIGVLLKVTLETREVERYADFIEGRIELPKKYLIVNVPGLLPSLFLPAPVNAL